MCERAHRKAQDGTVVVSDGLLGALVDGLGLDPFHPDVQLVSVAREGSFGRHEGYELVVKRFFDTLAEQDGVADAAMSACLYPKDNLYPFYICAAR